MPSEGVGAGARPVNALRRRCDGDCKGRGDEEERGKHLREAEHIGVGREGLESGRGEGRAANWTWGGKEKKVSTVLYPGVFKKTATFRLTVGRASQSVTANAQKDQNAQNAQSGVRGTGTAMTNIRPTDPPEAP